MTEAFKGLSYFIDGFGLITKPGIKRYVIIPALINIIIFIGMFVIARHYMAELNVWLIGFVPTWLEWLSWLLWAIFLFSFVIFFIYTFVIVANLVAAPFNGLLSEKVELYLTGKELQKRSLMDFIKDVPRIIGRQLAIIGYYGLRAFLILILFFIPIVHAFVPFIWFLFSAWFLAMSYMDYPTDNHNVSFEMMREKLSQRNIETLSFGVCILFASLIPFINFFTIPASVAGATKFWLQEFES